MANATDTHWQGSFYNSSLTWSDTEEKRSKQATQLHLLETGHMEAGRAKRAPVNLGQHNSTVLWCWGAQETTVTLSKGGVVLGRRFQEHCSS